MNRLYLNEISPDKTGGKSYDEWCKVSGSTDMTGGVRLAGDGWGSIGPCRQG